MDGFGFGFAGDTINQALVYLAITVLVAVFIADLIGNLIVFDNRFVNALVTGLIFFGFYALADFVLGEFDSLMVGVVGGFLVFCADLISNMFTFNNRFMNALLTTIIAALSLALVVWLAAAP